jgi:hypothetical protein
MLVAAYEPFVMKIQYDLYLRIMLTPSLTLELVLGIFQMYYLQPPFCAFWSSLGHELVILVVHVHFVLISLK